MVTENQQEGIQGGPSEVELASIGEYNRRHGCERGYIEMIKDAKFLIMWFYRECMRDYRSLFAAWKSIVLTLTTFVYILSPLDIIPEAVFGVIGVIDDAAIMIVCLVVVAN